MNGRPTPLEEQGVPLDLFIQSLTEQLDKVQAAMAVKAKVADLPLTFAVKDLSLELRGFLSLIDEDIYVRPALPGEAGASVVKLDLTTITRPMIEENARRFKVEEPGLKLHEALGDTLTEEERRRLERLGVENVEQLTELEREAGPEVIARLARLPVGRLQQALMRAARPRVARVEPLPARKDPQGAVQAPGIRLRGINLTPGGQPPRVLLGDRRVPLRMAGPRVLEWSLEDAPPVSEAEIDFGDGEVLRVPLPEAGRRPLEEIP